MAGQNLLDKGRTGALHADDENWCSLATNTSLPLAQELRREYRLARPDVVGHVARVVGNPQPFNCVGPGIILEGLLVLADVSQSPPQCVVQIHSIASGEIAAPKKPLHIDNFGVTETIAFDRGEAPIRFAERG